MTQTHERNRYPAITLLVCGTLMALGWAINGMIGNAPGAAIPGAFAAMAAVAILRPASGEDDEPPALFLTRAAAFGAMGFWFGGEMTYGQNFGLMLPNTADGAHYYWGRSKEPPGAGWVWRLSDLACRSGVTAGRKWRYCSPP